MNTNSIDLELSSSQYLSITDANQTGLDLASDFTIEAWVKTESTPAASGTLEIFDKYTSAGDNRSYRFYYQNNAGTMKIVVNTSSTGAAGQVINHFFNYTLTNGTWFHLAMTYDLSAGTALLYVNGVSQGSVSGGNTSIYNGTGAVNIGAINEGTALYFDGLIDDVRVWSDKRTQQEVQDNMSVELVGDEAGLVAYWKLNDSLLDETSNDNDLTNNNSATFSTDVPFSGETANTTNFFNFI